MRKEWSQRYKERADKNAVEREKWTGGDSKKTYLK